MGRNAPRKELSRSDLAKRGVIGIVVILLLVALNALRTSTVFVDSTDVSAQLLNAGGSLRPGSDVKISGVIVGKVTDVKRGDGGGVRVGMKMNAEDIGDVPGNVVARILPATVFGTTFVDLVVQGQADKEALKPGDVIPADKTQGTLELQQALDDIDRLVKALGPAELASAIGSAAEALDGRGEQIGQIIETADRYLGRLNPRMPLVRSDLRKLAANLSLANRIAPDLLDATEDGLVTLGTIVDQQANIAALITGGTKLTATAQTFLARNEGALVRMLNNSISVVDAIHDNRVSGISGAININIAVANKVPTATGKGFLDSEGPVRATAPPFYNSGDRPRYPGAAARTSISGMTGGGR